jgi:hypothetical protein
MTSEKEKRTLRNASTGAAIGAVIGAGFEIFKAIETSHIHIAL